MPAASVADQPLDTRSELILALGRNRRLAHRFFFGHRHPQETPPFHHEIIDLWHSATRYVLTEAFRGGAKSTLAEEAIAIMACYRDFSNVIVLGESYDRACERLRAIKHEFEHNEKIEELFGSLVGDVWQEGRIILKNGVIIQAFGRGQSLRGSKHLDKRPDCCFGDDMEDEESIATPDARDKFKQWVLKVVIPSLAPGFRFRVAGTPLDPQAWLVTAKANQNWVSRSYPIKHKDPDGNWRATWPARFPLDEVDRIEREFTDAGGTQEFQQEYMCEAVDPATRVFVESMLRTEVSVRTWQATYACFDPARTVKLRSALTGWAVWSWVANRLVVWDAGGALLHPDEITSKVFEINDLYSPVHVGVEETGLNEFILQPLRHEQTRRGVTVPIKPLNAPKGKIDFIRGLQPFFKAGEIVFAKPLPELVKQLLAFPTGQIDIPNALAYALRMRPGQPVFDGFRQDHIVLDMGLAPREPVYLAVNATAQYTTGALCQIIKGGLHVAADWVSEGGPDVALSDIVRGASVLAGRLVRVTAGPVHFGPHDTVGLRGAGRKVPVEISRGGAELEGRTGLAQLLKTASHGGPSVRVSTSARWTLNGFSGGYCYPVTKHGALSDFTEPGPYRVLMEGLESFAALMGTGAMEDDSERAFAYSSSGRKYLTALAGNRGPSESKRA